MASISSLMGDGPPPPPCAIPTRPLMSLNGVASMVFPTLPNDPMIPVRPLPTALIVPTAFLNPDIRPTPAPTAATFVASSFSLSPVAASPTDSKEFLGFSAASAASLREPCMVSSFSTMPSRDSHLSAAQSCIAICVWSCSCLAEAAIIACLSWRTLLISCCIPNCAPSSAIRYIHSHVKLNSNKYLDLKACRRNYRRQIRPVTLL